MAYEKYKKGGGKRAECPKCGKVFEGPTAAKQVVGHIGGAHGRKRKGPKVGGGGRPSKPARNVRVELKLVDYIQDLYPKGIPTDDKEQLLKTLRGLGYLRSLLEQRYGK